VTTILANFVGRSEVSAITHTPDSGPFELVTTPPMSSGSIATVVPLLCCALTPNVNDANEAISPLATANEPILGFTRNFMCSSSPPVQRVAIARMLAGLGRHDAAKAASER
jgi:hypothetical protein